MKSHTLNILLILLLLAPLTYAQLDDYATPNTPQLTPSQVYSFGLTYDIPSQQIELKLVNVIRGFPSRQINSVLPGNAYMFSELYSIEMLSNSTITDSRTFYFPLQMGTTITEQPCGKHLGVPCEYIIPETTISYATIAMHYDDLADTAVVKNSEGLVVATYDLIPFQDPASFAEMFAQAELEDTSNDDIVASPEDIVSTPRVLGQASAVLSDTPFSSFQSFEFIGLVCLLVAGILLFLFVRKRK